MSVADELKTAFSGQRGKVLLVGGGVVVVYLWWTRSRTPSTPQVVQSEPDGLHRTASAPSGETTAGPGALTRPANNGEWQSRAVQILGAPPYNYSETGVYNAIAKAYNGQPITAQEENWIRDAMRALGAPPEGMPPLTIGAPAGNPQQPNRVMEPDGGFTQDGLHYAAGRWYDVTQGETWASIAAKFGRTAWQLQEANKDRVPLGQQPWHAARIWIVEIPDRPA